MKFWNEEDEEVRGGREGGRGVVWIEAACWVGRWGGDGEGGRGIPRFIFSYTLGVAWSSVEGSGLYRSSMLGREIGGEEGGRKEESSDLFSHTYWEWRGVA